ncbi:ECF transporter S component [Fictibacillus nanhaiensis]|uniref:ECF transporter S component n=1 Tax=Fictibacillus nanhaiensis TaxID=742169 RepID=UPI00203AF10B|nr:ECF transporter S component [Fictibacillus nanhaiensis]MCM3731412.1 ECF transporter S component [Fictibacillus nanhaiensis]
MRSNHPVLFVSFLSLAIAGSFIKIPAGIGTLAFDSMPALVAASLWSPGWGMIVACAGHLMSAGLAGFPFGPLHVLVAVQMAGLTFLFGYFYRKKNRHLAFFLFVAGNGIIAPFMLWPIIGKGIILAIMPGLIIASVLNAFVSMLIIPRLKPFWERRRV